MSKQLVIFDLDGTLLNTIADLAHSTNHALEQHGYPTQPLSIYPTLVGNGINKLLERSLPPEARSAETVAALRESFQPHYDHHCAEHTHPYSGIEELLTTLQERGIAIAVASNKYQAATEQLVNHYFGHYTWSTVLGQREGVDPKPHPAIVQQIMLQAGVKPSEVLYVGDSGVDMLTAHRAGVASVGVSWGFRPISELVEHGAGIVIDTPSEILTLLA